MTEERVTDGRTVLITGASSGLGAAMADRMRALGWRVLGTSRSPRSDDARIEWIPMDVCDDASVARGVEAALERTSQLDGLVCNAGCGIFGPVEETSLDRARTQLETNFFGVLRVLGPILTHMRERGSGRILLVGSLAGRAPIPFQAHYSASKAAIEALAFSLANEVRPFGLSVHLIEPGDIDTPFNESMDWGERSGTSPYAGAVSRCEDIIRKSLPQAPGPEIVANAVAHALTSRRPKLRYAVGRETALVGLGKRLLSDRACLALIRRHFGL